MENLCRLSGTIAERDALHYTPAGVPYLKFQLQHRAQVMEATLLRQVELLMSATALGEPALLLARVPLQAPLILEGFLAPRSHRSPWPVLHVQMVHFIDPHLEKTHET